MIFNLRDLIPHADVGTQIATGQWVRAMHEPFRGGLFDRLRDAAAVVRGRDGSGREVFAVRWPRHGEYEQATVRADGD